MKKIFLLLIVVFTSQIIMAQEVFDLYLGKIPNAKITPVTYKEISDTAKDGKVRIRQVSVPQLIAFYPQNPNGTSVIICPGGGYAILAITHEGYQVAEALNKQGITAFILKYRLPSDEIMVDKTIGPLQDAQQAIKTVRENAKKWSLDTVKIGIMGFSAGGHLASTLGTHYQKWLIDNPNKINLRPNFMVLGYPVITMAENTHQGSKINLLGQSPSEELVKLYSNHLQINQNTPPTFIFHANDDKAVPSENSIDFVRALKLQKVKSQFYLYQAGGHGYGMENKLSKDSWFDSMINWMSLNGF
jgi:acetyl esterase/lipase